MPSDLTSPADPIERAAEILRAGGIVAMPTDTQYGLAALAGQGAAIMRLFALKRRPDDQALPIFLPTVNWLETVVADVPEEVQALARAAWPGALTLVLPRNPDWRSLAVPGRSVAVRIPDHPVALALLQAVGQPITGTSANRHSEAAATTPEEVQAAFGEELEVLPAGGTAAGGKASTILDCSGLAPRLVRAGGVSEEWIEQALGQSLAVGGLR